MDTIDNTGNATGATPWKSSAPICCIARSIADDGAASRLTTNGRASRGKPGLLQDRVDVDVVAREHRRQRRDDAGPIGDGEAHVVRRS